MKMTLAALAAVACVAGSVAAAPRAEAADRVDVGVLVCHVKASIGWIVTSKQEMTCTFSSSQGDLPQRYAGSITTVGLDLGVTGAGIMTWGVLAVTAQVAPGALAGTYVGATGDIALGVGVAGNALIGADKAFALNPFSVEGNVGASLALGAAGLTLRYVP
ncbi:DUF992 domain-containing protein [Starkeya sp. ORNL1]|uniref:DUF992 domain-containing protein n=1 Tax=Starkeya sp. ORNL1 TaxID=2709380 RepID=UPI001464021D|nr:DUF992 domain-containing protein [Starkeya sp. ORNL1]QJP13211.1 DUF992 domain-containing protein [Starkeya sp. ORNL1]